MTELTLELDQKANESINDLMSHYRVGSRAELISKAIEVLKIVATVDRTDGELVARKGRGETRLRFR